MSIQVADGSGQSGRRGLAYLVSGAALSQLIQFLASILLTRLYLPAEYGVYASLVAISSVLATLFVAGYPTAIPLAETQDRASELAWLSWLLAIAMSAVAFSALVIVKAAGAELPGASLGWLGVPVVPMMALSLALVPPLQMLASRERSFGSLGRSSVVSAGGLVTTQLALGASGAGAGGLALGYVVGRVMLLVALIGRSRLDRMPTPSVLRSVARLNSEWPRWYLPAVLLNLLGTTSVVPLVSLLYGTEFAGWYSLALQVLFVPSVLVGQAIGMVLFPTFAQRDRVGALAPQQILTYAKALSTSAVALFLPVFMLGPGLFALAFGERWREAGSIAATLALWPAAGFVSSPLSTIAVVKRQFRRVLAVAALETTLRLAAIGLGGVAHSPGLGIVLYSLCGMAICLFSVTWSFHLSHIEVRELMRSNSWRIALSVAALVALFVVRGYGNLLLSVGVTVVGVALALTSTVKIARP